MNHKVASGEHNIKLDTTSEESDDEMINTLNKSQKNKNEKIILNAFSESFYIAKEIPVEKFIVQL